MYKDNIRYFSDEFSQVYPASHALWRVFEANQLKRFKFAGSMLDLGCGDGSFTSILLPRSEYLNLDIIGVDINRKSCEAAERRGYYNQVICASSHDIPIPTGSLTMVYSNSVLEHIEKFEETLEEINRILQKDGKFLFSVPARSFGTNLFYSRFLKRIGLDPISKLYSTFINRIFRHYNCLSPVEWGELLKRYGFEIVRMRGSISSETEKYWDIFLPLSYFQYFFTKTFNTKLPFRAVNKIFVRKLVTHCRSSESSLDQNGSNLVILANKL